MAMSRQHKDARKADRINRQRIQAHQNATLNLFSDNTGPTLMTAESVAAKRQRDQETGRRALASSKSVDEECQVAADLMYHVFIEFRGQYLADLRENSITRDMKRWRYGIWEAHLHSIGVITITATSTGSVWQVVADRPAGKEIYEPIPMGRAAMIDQKK